MPPAQWINSVNLQDTHCHFLCPKLKCEWDFTVTERAFLEESSCLSAMPPRLFVLEFLGCMKSSLLLLKTTVAHRRIRSSD